MPVNPDIVDSAAPFATWEFHIVRNAGWVDPLPQLLDEDEEPLDLTGKTLELRVSPKFGDVTPLIFLTSAGSAGITIDDAALGLATVSRTLAQVRAAFPYTGVYEWWLRILDTGVYEEIARGAFYVHPGEVATS